MNSSGVNPGRSSHSGVQPAPGASREDVPDDDDVVVLGSSMVAADNGLAGVVLVSGTIKAVAGEYNIRARVAVSFMVGLDWIVRLEGKGAILDSI